jgi:hypothetical protein
VRTDLDTLVIALYVRIDDALTAAPELCRWRPKVGIAPRLSDAELLTLAVMQALLGFTFRSPLPCAMPAAPLAPVPVPARPVRRQPAAAGSGTAGPLLHRCPGRRH